MSSTIAEIKQLVRELELRFWVADDGSRIAIPYFSDDGLRQVEVQIGVYEQGAFVQFTADVLFNLNSEQTTFESLLRAANAMNHNMRFIKLALDMEHQIVRGYADFWVGDGSMTPQQFRTMLGNFCSAAFYAQGELIGVIGEMQIVKKEEAIPF